LESGWSGFGLGSIPKPLFQQEGSGCAVQATAAVAVKALDLGGQPAAGMLIYPGQRQRLAGLPQSPLELEPVAAAVQGLPCRPLLGVEWQTDHQHLHPPLQNKRQEPPAEVGVEIAAGQGLQGGHGDAERITAGQTDPLAAHVEGQGRSGEGSGHSAVNQRGGEAAAAGLEAGLELLEHGTDALGRPPQGL